MDFKQIHHLREVLAKDWRGEAAGTMEYSFDNASYLQPRFMEVPFTDQDKARDLYFELGGRRDPETRIGTTVMIPNRRSWWQEW